MSSSEKIYEDESAKANAGHFNLRIILTFLIGIALVYGLTILINSTLIATVSEQKMRYYLSIVTSNALFVILGLSIMHKIGLSWADLGWNKISWKQGIKSVLQTWLLIWALQVIYMAMLLFRGINPPPNALVEILVNPTIWMFIANVLLIAVVAPIVEELLFRGMLFQGLKSYFGVWTAVFLSAAIFSALHFQLIGFIPRLMLGIGLAYLYEKHRSILPSIGLHAINNLVAILLASVPPS